MTSKVNPPQEVRIPSKIFNDPELRSYFESIQTILFQLWSSVGDAEQLAVVPTNADITLSNEDYGKIILVSATSADVTITLPDVSTEDLGKSIIIVLLDNTFDCYASRSGDDLINGATTLLIDGLYDAIHLTTVTSTDWITR